jgi:hypothetical protein
MPRKIAREISLTSVALAKSKKPGKRCLRFDLQCALPLVLLISKMEYFVADDTCIIRVFQGTDLRSHMNLS